MEKKANQSNSVSDVYSQSTSGEGSSVSVTTSSSSMVNRQLAKPKVVKKISITLKKK